MKNPKEAEKSGFPVSIQSLIRHTIYNNISNISKDPSFDLFTQNQSKNRKNGKKRLYRKEFWIPWQNRNIPVKEDHVDGIESFSCLVVIEPDFYVVEEFL